MRPLRVPIDVQRQTGYSWAAVSVTWRHHTRRFRVAFLRAR